MDQLPQELVDNVCSCLPQKDLKNVLTLSSKFRYAAERYSNQFREYDMDECNTEKFIARYSGYRLSFLKLVKFRSRFPLRDDSPPLQYESIRENAEELREKDETFTRQIHLLFATLKTTEEKAKAQSSLGRGRYRLCVYAPTRLIHRKFEDFERYPYLYHSSWRVHLINSYKLPNIASVRYFEVREPRGANSDVTFDRRYGYGYDYPPEYCERFNTAEYILDLRIIVDLATKFPNLDSLGCTVGGSDWCRRYNHHHPTNYFEQDWAGPRLDARKEFASAVSSCVTELPSSLKGASLDFLNVEHAPHDIDHEQPLPDLVGSAQTDPFSSSLRILSNNLRYLQIRTMADGSLFWTDDDTTPFWPHLEVLDVMFHIATPNGGWYFQGPRGEGRDAVGFQVTDAHYPPLETSDFDREMDDDLDENVDNLEREFVPSHHLVIPYDERLRPFLESFAKAANKMPSLRNAQIWSQLCGDMSTYSFHNGGDVGSDIPNGSDLAWGIVFLSPNPSLVEKCGEQWLSRELEWRTGKWRPDADLRSLFQQIGRERYGEDLVEFRTDIGDKSPFTYDEDFREAFFGTDTGRISFRPLF